MNLYIDPPASTTVVCLDEKTQIRPDRKTDFDVVQSVPSEFGAPTTNLFAALSVHDGRLVSRCMQRSRHQELIRFLNILDAEFSGTVHLIMDNYTAHHHGRTFHWFARHPRFIVHFTPTSMSWVNAVEVFFAKLSRNCLQQRSFGSLIELQIAIKAFVADLNYRLLL